MNDSAQKHGRWLSNEEERERKFLHASKGATRPSISKFNSLKIHCLTFLNFFFSEVVKCWSGDVSGIHSAEVNFKKLEKSVFFPPFSVLPFFGLVSCIGLFLSSRPNISQF